MMNYYLLSEQDLKELAWELESILFEIREKIEAKKIEEPNSEDKDPEPQS